MNDKQFLRKFKSNSALLTLIEVFSNFRRSEMLTFLLYLTNYFSFTPMMYKLGLIRTLVDRVYKINNSWVGFHKDVQKLIFLLRKNCFPSSVIDRIISRHLAKSYNPSPTHNATLNSGKPSSHYFKLPYVGRFSDIAQTKLRQLLKRYCRPLYTGS